MQLIHYGCEILLISKILDIENTDFYLNKPKHDTGLWCSPIESENGWKDFCLSEIYNTSKLETFVTFSLRENSLILVIDSKEDLIKIFEMKLWNGFNSEKVGYVSSHDRKKLNFKLLSKHFDAIHLTVNGDYSTRFGCGAEYKDLDLYGWDCECLLILNGTCIKPNSFVIY